MLCLWESKQLNLFSITPLTVNLFYLSFCAWILCVCNFIVALTIFFIFLQTCLTDFQIEYNRQQRAEKTINVQLLTLYAVMIWHIIL